MRNNYGITRRDFVVYGAALAFSSPSMISDAAESNGFEKLRKLAARVEKEIRWFRFLENDPVREQELMLGTIYDGEVKGRRVRLEIQLQELGGFRLIMRKNYTNNNQNAKKRTWDGGPGIHTYVDGDFEGNLLDPYNGVSIEHHGTDEKVGMDALYWLFMRDGNVRLNPTFETIEFASGSYANQTFAQLM